MIKKFISYALAVLLDSFHFCQAQSQFQFNWTEIALYSLYHFYLLIRSRNPTRDSKFLSFLTREFRHVEGKYTGNVLQALLQLKLGLCTSWIILIQINPIPHRGWALLIKKFISYALAVLLDSFHFCQAQSQFQFNWTDWSYFHYSHHKLRRMLTKK